MASLLPLRTDLPHYRFQVELEGTIYGFEFRWNDRSQAWMMKILTAEEELILTRRVVLGTPFTARFRDPRLPPGELEAIDTTGENQEAGLYDLGGRVQILYRESTDLAT